MSDTREEHFQVTRHKDVTVIHVADGIRYRERVYDFTDALINFCEQKKPAKLLVSFDYAVFFGSEGISALIGAQRRVNKHGGKMKLCGMTRALRKVFRICQLDGRVFEIHDTNREAMAAFQD